MAESIITNVRNWNDSIGLVGRNGAEQESSAAVEYMLAEITGGFPCIPMEGTPGKSIQFTNAYDGKGYSMSYHIDDLDDGSRYVHVHVDGIEHDPAYDNSALRDKQRQYRITFTSDATEKADAFELAWLLSKYELDVVAKSGRPTPMLFVQGTYSGIESFVREATYEFGDFIKAIELPQNCFGGFVSVMAA